MKLSISFAGQSTNVSPAQSVPDTEITDSDKSVMPTSSTMSMIPGEVSVMPSSGQEHMGFFQELQSILFSSRVKVHLPEEDMPHPTPSAVSSGQQIGTLSIPENSFGGIESL